jgi:cation diffusion facilitator CzcD-associated flavoprotein CzcO
MTLLEARPALTGALPGHVDVLIAGGGFSGLGMAIRLKQEGNDDLLALERGEEVGGTLSD